MSAPLTATFFSRLRKITHFYWKFYRRKASAFRADKVALPEALAKATNWAQKDLDYPILMNQRVALRFRLFKTKERMIACRKASSRIHYKLLGNQVSHEFFRAVRDKNSSACISALHDAHDTRSPTEMKLSNAHWHTTSRYMRCHRWLHIRLQGRHHFFQAFRPHSPNNFQRPCWWSGASSGRCWIPDGS